jgi:predicted PurR-regulated permease PerM
MKEPYDTQSHSKRAGTAESSAATSAPQRSVLHTALWLVAVVLLVLLVVFTFRILLVIFAGLLLATVLHAVASAGTRRLHLPYWAALTLLVALALGSAAALIASFAPDIGQQFHTLTQDLTQSAHQLLSRLSKLSQAAGNSGTAAPKPNESAPSGEWLGRAVHVFGNSVEVLGGLIVIAFLGIYVAAKPALYRDALISVTPARHRTRLLRALEAVRGNLARWLMGRALAMLFVGVTTAICFALLKVPLALALGVFAGVLTFVEYAGAVIAAVPPIVLALSQGTTTVLLVAALFTVLHVIEGYVLTPLLARATVHIPPAVTLACQVLLGALAGALGLTFSTPLLVVVISAVQAWRGHDAHPKHAR